MTITRLGAVSYLNTRPLTWGLEHGLQTGGFTLEFDVPSRCAERLAEGQVDLALAPSVEFARACGTGKPGLSAVPGVCIASDGPAASVLLVSRVPFERIRGVGVDKGSRTSVALLRILLRDRWKNDPPFTEEAPDLPAMLARHDAALVIGDEALFADTRAAARGGEIQVADLGAEWKAQTGLPFVFAFWAGRPAAAAPEVVGTLQASLAAGLAHLPDIAASWRWQGAPRTTEVLAYLRDNMRYRWGQRERDGLLRFYLLAARHGLIEEVPEITYFPQAAEVAGR